jgi:hypothetical protein
LRSAQIYRGFHGLIADYAEDIADYATPRLIRVIRDMREFEESMRQTGLANCAILFFFTDSMAGIICTDHMPGKGH